MAEPSFQHQWRERLASGSKLASKALAQALKEDGGRVAQILPLTADASPIVRVSALRALEIVAEGRPELVAPHAKELVEGLAHPEPDAQEAALGALGHVAHHARAEAALALPLIGELLHARRPGLREEAARALGRLACEAPLHAPAAAAHLAQALNAARSPRAAQEAREILAALEGLLPHLPAPDRLALAPRITPLRGHPNIQVRERAGRLARALEA